MIMAVVHFVAINMVHVPVVIAMHCCSAKQARVQGLAGAGQGPAAGLGNWEVHHLDGDHMNSSRDYGI